MKSILLVALALTTAQANAGSINLDMRSDLLSQTYNDAALVGGTGTGVSNYRFNIQTGRLVYKGSLNEKTSFAARIRFAAKDQTAMDKRDNTNTTLDWANVAYNFSDMIKFTMGKMGSEIGGFEGGTAGPDVYFASEAYGGGGYLGTTQLTNPANGLKLNGFTNALYFTGAKLSFMFDAANTLSVMAGDLDGKVGRSAAATSDVPATQNKSMFGLAYNGSFMDKTLAVIASYHTETLAPDTTATFSALGLGYTIGPVLIQADYLMNTSSIVTGTTPNTLNPKDVLTSAVVKVVYAIDPTLSAQLKVVSSTEMFDASALTGVSAVSATNKYMDYGAAIEWKPKAEDAFRYHVAYNSRNETLDLSGADTRQLNEVIVGMRVNADFLK